MANEKRLTWKQSIDGYTDVGLRDGVTVGEAICKLADLEERDAVEVVHGRWETNCDQEECEKDFYCSVCEELLCDFDTTALYPGENCYYYCPNCGAKMDGDGNA